MYPAKTPARIPRKGFQKYHVVKNSFTFFGRDVTLQLLSMSFY